MLISYTLITASQITDSGKSRLLSLSGSTVYLPGLSGAVAAGKNALNIGLGLVVNVNAASTDFQAGQEAVQRVAGTENEASLHTKEFISGTDAGNLVSTGNFRRLFQNYSNILTLRRNKACIASRYISSPAMQALFRLSVRMLL